MGWYLKTNRNSLRFAVSASIIFLVAALLDAVAFIGLYAGLAVQAPTEEESELIMEVISGFTVGKSICLVFVIPFMLLFSYLKQHKNPGMDKYVPIGGIGFVVFAIIETAFFGILWLL